MVPSQCGHKGYRKDCDILKDRRKNWPEREEMHENVEVGEETRREMETKFPRPIIVCFFLFFLSAYYFSQVFPDVF